MCLSATATRCIEKKRHHRENDMIDNANFFVERHFEAPPKAFARDRSPSTTTTTTTIGFIPLTIPVSDTLISSKEEK
jgi:hypothetical protein